MSSEALARARAYTDEQFNRIMAQFDDIEQKAESILAQMRADGLIRDPNTFGRATDINRIPPLAPGEVQLSPERINEGDECEVRR